jgi:MarR-like DNA-binding transcriptional regulator SgrR of sgrS sRNA
LLEKAQKCLKDGDLSKLFTFVDTYFDELQKQEFFSKIPHLFGYYDLHYQNGKLDVLTFPYFRQLFSLDPAFIERQSE